MNTSIVLAIAIFLLLIFIFFISYIILKRNLKSKYFVTFQNKMNGTISHYYFAFFSYKFQSTISPGYYTISCSENLKIISGIYSFYFSKGISKDFVFTDGKNFFYLILKCV